MTVLIALVMGQCLGPLSRKLGALTDKPARELARGITGTEQLGDGRLANGNGALEIESSPSWCGSLTKDGRSMGITLLGLSYG